MLLSGADIVIETLIEQGTKTVFGYPCSPVSYTHLRAHETRGNLVCRLLLEKKK